MSGHLGRITTVLLLLVSFLLALQGSRISFQQFTPLEEAEQHAPPQPFLSKKEDASLKSTPPSKEEEQVLEKQPTLNTSKKRRRRSEPPNTAIGDNLWFQKQTGSLRERLHLRRQKRDIILQHRDMNSVDYMSCCGLGHRLSKNADAYFVVTRVFPPNTTTLRVFWGICPHYEGDNQTTEVWNHLFGPILLSDLHFSHLTTIEGYSNSNSNNNNNNNNNSSSTSISVTNNISNLHNNMAVRFRNEVYGFHKMVRTGNVSDCPCHLSKYDSDVEFYSLIANKFRRKPEVDQFVEDHVRGHWPVLGLHVRAGNNETGNFRKKHRWIEEPDIWVSRITQLLLRIINEFSNNKSNSTKQPTPKPSFRPLVYIATDTPAMIGLFQNRLASSGVAVLTLPQDRPGDGEGVWFGQSVNQQSHCLGGWETVLMDMLILSQSSDIVVAARPSSFTQTLPMMLAYQDNKTYCEANYNGTDVRCYTSFHEWCCEGVGAFHLEGVNQRYEYQRVPGPTLWNDQQQWGFRNRPRTFRNFRDFLPFDFESVDNVQS